MSVILNTIELKNWFQYKGDYKDNLIEFNEGLNIIVGDNNAGKTKLHNAFRFILKDEVLIEKERTGYIEEKIDNENISKIFNQETLERSIKIDESGTLGVRIVFTEIKDEYTKDKYQLTKEIKIRKEGNTKFKIIETKSEVHQIDSRTKSPRLNPNLEFEKISSKIIPNNFLSFFFIEGEQLGLMTPLEGDKLKDTINSIVNINVIDEIENFSNSDFKKATEKKKSEIEIIDSNTNKQQKENAIRKRDLIEKKSSLEKEIENSILEIDDNIKIRDDYKANAEASKKNKELLSQLNSLIQDYEVNESKINTLKNAFIGNIMNQSTFSLSKLRNEENIKESLDTFSQNLRQFITERRTELDSKKLTPKEAEMIQSLEKSQPKPEILEKMVRENWCFVCNTELKSDSISYIENKLIPFFRDELENDLEITKLESIRQMINSISISSTKYFRQDLSYFKEEEEKIIDKIEKRNTAYQKKQDFIEKYGTLENDDNVSLTTFEYAIEKIKQEERRRDTLMVEYNKTEKELKDILSNQNRPGSLNLKSDKFILASELHEFSQLLSLEIDKVKTEAYSVFASDLEEKSTLRYRDFMAHNKTSKNHKIQVEINKNNRNQFEFKINVINSLNEKQEQPGGADQALRRVAVVFGLLDMAHIKKGYPFIADAPISKLSEDAKKAFFKSVLNDKALSQCIILNMDLWSSEKNNITELGNEILKLVESKPTSSFITLERGSKGVNVSYLKK
jgi:DNA sulfur modification protein DndD